MYDKYNFTNYREYLKPLKNKNIRIEGVILNMKRLRNKKNYKTEVTLGNLKCDQISQKHLTNEHLNLSLLPQIANDNEIFQVGNTISVVAKVNKYTRSAKNGIITVDYGIKYLNKSKINLIKKRSDSYDARTS